MYPHERSLVKRFENKPFVIIGVNSDEDREALKKVIAKENITWRSFWNGGSTEGPIAKTWNVSGWPTLYLLDHEGVIHYKGHGEDEAKFDARIEKLVEAAEQAGRK